MPERLHPGVYVEEVSGGVKPVEGVSTSTAAFLGESARGIPAMAQFMSSFAEYERAFGGLLPGDRGLLGHAVSGFFAAGGKRAYVVRVLPGNAQKGQSAPVASRISGNPVPESLQFVAKGAGLWSTNLRIVIGDSANFKDDAFKVEVQWSDNGAIRRLEVFDDVRTDPSHEDYVVERMKSSRYVEAIDLFARALDVPAPPVLIAAQLPLLRSKPIGAAETLSLPEGKRLTVSTWDIGQPDAVPTTQVVDLTKANVNAAFANNPPQPANGYYDLTATELSAILDKYLTAFKVTTGSNPTTIDIAIKDLARTVVTVTPPVAQTTYDFTAPVQTLTIAINGAPPANVPVTGAIQAAVTGAELRDAIAAALPQLGVTLGANGTVVVTGVPSESAVPTLVIGMTTAGRIQAATVPGQQGLPTPSSKYGSLRMSISEAITATAPGALRALGFTTLSRGYAANSAANPLVRPVLTASGAPIRVDGGTDGQGALTATDFIGDARDRTGLHALDGTDVNMVTLPGRNDIAYITAGITYCDGRGDCFFIADGPGSTERGTDIKADEARTFVDSLPMRSKNAAMFYPWIQVPDPTGIGRNPTRFVAPSGHVAGIFARTDATRGVWKAPAGIETTVPNAVGLQAQVLDADQDLLNPASLNCLRQFPGVGIVSWGTRTLSSDPEWRYVPVRRMGLFLKESLRRGLQWAVFEPNDAELWGRIRINIEAFMMTLFRQGAFQGATPDEAFAVQCDRTTNPQENVDAGIVTAKVAFAPLKPAEFVVIEVSQKSLLVA